LSIQLIKLKVQLVHTKNIRIVNWLKNYVLYCRNCRHLHCLLRFLLGLILLLLGRFSIISIVLFHVVGVTTFDRLTGCCVWLFKGIDDELFSKLFDFFVGIGPVGFLTSTVIFRLPLPLVQTLVIILLDSLQGFVVLLLLLCPTCPINLIVELGPSILSRGLN